MIGRNKYIYLLSEDDLGLSLINNYAFYLLSQKVTFVS